MPSQINVRGVLELDGRGWDATLRKASDGVNRFANEGLSELKGVIAGAFSVGVIESFISSTVDAMTSIKEFSEQAGISTDEVQLLQIAARKVGLEFEDFQRALTKIGTARKEAAESNKELRNVFAAYGITLEDLNNPMLKNVDLLEKMKNRIEQLSSTAAGREDLKAFFGAKGGDKLGAALEEYFKLKQNISDTPLFSNRDIEDVDKFEKALKEIKRQFEVRAGGPLGGIAGMFSEQSASGKLKAYLRSVAPFLPSGVGGFAEYFGRDSATGSTAIGGSNSGEPVASGAGSPMFHDKIAEEEENKILESQNRLLEAQHKLAYDGLTDSQKKVELQKEINQLLVDAASIEPSSEALANDLRTTATGKMGELQALNQKSSGASSDSLTRVGNFLGSAPSTITRIGERTNQLLTGIHTTLQSINTKVGGGAAFP